MVLLHVFVVYLSSKLLTVKSTQKCLLLITISTSSYSFWAFLVSVKR